MPGPDQRFPTLPHRAVPTRWCDLSCHQYAIEWMTCICTIGILLSCFGCERFSAANYHKAVESGRKKIAVVSEIESLFPDSVQNFIGHDGGSFSDPMTWNTEVLLYDRYVLTMQVDVRVDRSFSTVTEVLSAPQFWLIETLQVTPIPGGGWDAINGKNWTFGIDEWEDLVAANGRFESIGISLQHNGSVANFSQMYAGIRRDRLP